MTDWSGNGTVTFRKFQRRLWHSSAIVGVVLSAQILSAPIAAADDFVVDTATTTTDGGNNFNNNDSLTITNTGSITPNTGSGVDGGSNNTVANDGSIATNGTLRFGISVNNLNTITNSGSIFTTGGASHGILASDNNVITNSGSISTTDTDSYGILAVDNNIITNTGIISTAGTDSMGIYIDEGNMVTNSGTISTTGDGSEGIYAEEINNTIINSGLISTTGNNAQGIYIDDFNTVINSGSISTSGDGSEGVYGDDSNTITSSGTISTSGATDAHGIYAKTNNTVTNTGTIFTSGADSDGIYVNTDNTVTNSGIIVTSGAGSIGIFADTDDTVTNSGKVVSTQSNSFFFVSDTILNLMAPAFIGGEIQLGGDATVNITTGASHSVLWDFSTFTSPMVGGMPNIDGTVPAFYNATTFQFATFDPTVLAATSDHLAGFTSGLSGIMQGRLERDGSVSGSNSNLASFAAKEKQGQSSERIDQAFDTASSSYAPNDDNAFWISALGSRFDYDGNNATLDREISNWGFAIGYDWMHSEDLKLGIMGGYMANTLTANSKFTWSYDNESTGYFAGIYGRKDNQDYYIDFALTGGVLDHQQHRFVNDNLAALGVSYANSEYDSYWISPEIAIGKEYDAGNGWMASPSARLRYATQWLDGYTETGPSAANAIVGDRQVSIGEASVEYAATKQYDRGTFTYRVGYLYRTSFGDDATSITMIGQTVSVGNFAEDRSGLYIGANTNFDISDTMALELGAKATMGDGFTGIEGNIKLVAKF